MPAPIYDNQADWKYHFPLPLLDMRASPVHMPYGHLAHLSGTDGRYTTTLRPFPGFRRLRRLEGFSAAAPPLFFRCVTIPQGGSAQMIRGFVVRGSAAGTVFHYYRPGSGWAQYVIDAQPDGDFSRAIDISVNGRYLYYAQGEQRAKVVYWDEDTSQLVTQDLGWEGTLDAPGVGTGARGNLLLGGDYEVAYRFVNTTRNLVGLMSPRKRRTISTNGYLSVRIQTPAHRRAAFDKIELFRTVRLSDGGSVLLHERTVDMPATDDEDRWWLGHQNTDGLSDGALALQPAYDPVWEEAGPAPHGNCILAMDGFTLMSDDAATFPYGYRWSNLLRDQPESFPVANHHRPTDGDPVLRLVRAGDTAWSFSHNGIWRAHQAGTKMRFSRVQEGWGAVSADAVVAFGRRLIVAASQGLIQIDIDTGQVEIYGALEGLFGDREHWAGQLDRVALARDLSLPAIFVLNPDTSQMAILWPSTETVSLLDNTPFVAATDGQDPEAGGPDRAWFITANGLIVTPDGDRANSKRTLLGIDGTVNGTASATSPTAANQTLIDAGATFYTGMTSGLQDCTLWIITGENALESRTIASNTATTITLATPFTQDIEAGDVYAISPVPFKVVGWPIGAADGKIELFLRHIITAMAAWLSATDRSWDLATNPAALIHYGVWRPHAAEPIKRVANGINLVPSDNFVGYDVSGEILLPGIELYASDLDFEVAGWIITGMRTASKKDR